LFKSNNLKLEFDKISNKRITKNILNQLFYLRITAFFGFLIILGCVLIAYSLVFHVKGDSLNALGGILIFGGFAIAVRFMLLIDNKRFNDYESYQRQAYILYLLQSIYSNIDLKKT